MEGFAKIDVFDFHDEGKNITADVADPAFEGLTFGIDLQTRSGVVVPGTTSDVISAGTPERNVVSDEFHDVNGFPNAFLDGILIVGGGHGGAGNGGDPV